MPCVPAADQPTWVRSVGKVAYEDGHVFRLVGTFQDITEVHKLSLELAERSVSENPIIPCLRQTEVIAHNKQITLTSRDGQEYGVPDSAAPILNELGCQLGVVSVFRDATERWRLGKTLINSR